MMRVLLATSTLLQLLAAPAVMAAQESPYIGAAACRDCHRAIYDAWEKTKHARAWQRLGLDDRKQSGCIPCHVTGTPEQIAREGDRPSLPGVQCERCHGPARAHAQTATREAPATSGLTRKVDARFCETCHSERSSHYRTFVYSAMVGFVHRTP